ncbi:hypothetical protein BT96DRAFT_956154 [Gymnopus androsaceus JB14]|uniref:DUF7587 domain-containing protein n=1 Tax=Gymnopus androsaceus JB14 TaxID=1447944 RepID=A0A6A4HY07_9AGAR|nr:hypothetical protein BT96DRAFT_956154 [Gymnopus androsaceus JB14]
MHNYPSSGDPLVETATYEDCIQHLSWETRSRSPFISTTFSFAWAFWDALRRFETGVKHDVEIAVIGCRISFWKSGYDFTVIAKKRHPHHWRWCRFAQESQSVLIHGSVPRSAVLASIPLRDVIQNLPSYFLKTPSSFQNNRPFVDPSLDLLLAWDFTNRKHTNFRRFCQEMGDRYTRMPYQKRVREIAIGSVRLALILLNPWFHRTVEDGDVQSAVGRIRDLSALVAHWPQQPGSRDFPEMASLMKALIQLLAEEVRGSNTRTRQTVAGEVLRLQQILPLFRRSPYPRLIHRIQ